MVVSIASQGLAFTEPHTDVAAVALEAFWATPVGRAWQQQHFATVLHRVNAGEDVRAIAAALPQPAFEAKGAIDPAARFVADVVEGVHCRRRVFSKLAALQPAPGPLLDGRIPMHVAWLAELDAQLRHLNGPLREMFLAEARALPRPVSRQLAHLA